MSAVTDRLILATSELMRRRGVAGTAISEILSTSGVARRSIYLNFANGKSDLVCAATRAAGSGTTAFLTSILGVDDPIAKFTELWTQLLESSGFDAGCPIVAAALGRTDAPEAADAAGEVFDDWNRLIAERLVGDGIAPDIADSLAVTIVSAIEGAVIVAQAQRTTRPLDEVGARLNELIALHLPTAS